MNNNTDAALNVLNFKMLIPKKILQPLLTLSLFICRGFQSFQFNHKNSRQPNLSDSLTLLSVRSLVVVLMNCLTYSVLPPKHS